MSHYVRRIGPKAWLLCSLALWLIALVGVRASAPGGQEAVAPPAKNSPQAVKASQTQAQVPAKTPAPAPAQAIATVGEDTCLTCHTDMRKGYEGSPHAVKTDARTPAAKQSCESCHGPGGQHVQDPAANPLIRFSKEKPDTINAVCTTCHSKQNHVVWQGSQHETRGLACSTCHSVHSYKSEDKQLKEVTERELCATCHRDKISKLDRSGHMPVREQKMQCSSCHNVHGTTNVRLLRKGDSISELCTSCHAEKRGPYLWEHAPSRDGCQTCHDPHGSSNERMLVAKPPLLCQRCHVATRHPSTIYDQQAIGSASAPSVRIYARSCVTCHSAIHGSNHPSGQRFVR